MLEVIRDENNDLTAVCEYLIFDNQGKLTEEGNVLFVGELEINPKHRGKGLIRYFIKRLMLKYPQLERCLFFRKNKYPKRDCRTWTRDKLELLLKGA